MTEQQEKGRAVLEEYRATGRSVKEYLDVSISPGRAQQLPSEDGKLREMEHELQKVRNAAAQKIQELESQLQAASHDLSVQEGMSQASSMVSFHHNPNAGPPPDVVFYDRRPNGGKLTFRAQNGSAFYMCDGDPRPEFRVARVSFQPKIVHVVFADIEKSVVVPVSEAPEIIPKLLDIFEAAGVNHNLRQKEMLHMFLKRDKQTRAANQLLTESSKRAASLAVEVERLTASLNGSGAPIVDNAEVATLNAQVQDLVRAITKLEEECTQRASFEDRRAAHENDRILTVATLEKQLEEAHNQLNHTAHYDMQELRMLRAEKEQFLVNIASLEARLREVPKTVEQPTYTETALRAELELAKKEIQECADEAERRSAVEAQRASLDKNREEMTEMLMKQIDNAENTVNRQTQMYQEQVQKAEDLSKIVTELEWQLESARALETSRAQYEEGRIKAFAELEAQVKNNEAVAKPTSQSAEMQVMIDNFEKAEAKRKQQESERSQVVVELNQQLSHQRHAFESTVRDLEEQLHKAQEQETQRAMNEEQRIAAMDQLEAQLETEKITAMQNTTALKMAIITLESELNDKQDTENKRAAHEEQRILAFEELQKQVSDKSEAAGLSATIVELQATLNERHQTVQKLEVYNANEQAARSESEATIQRLESDLSRVLEAQKQQDETHIRAVTTLEQQLCEVESASRITIQNIEARLDEALALEARRSQHEEERITAMSQLQDELTACSVSASDDVKATMSGLEQQLDAALQQEANRSQFEEERAKTVDELTRQLEELRGSAEELQTRRQQEAIYAQHSQQQASVISDLEQRIHTTEAAAKQTISALEQELVQAQNLEARRSICEESHLVNITAANDTISRLDAQIAEAGDLEAKRTALEDQRIKSFDELLGQRDALQQQLESVQADDGFKMQAQHTIASLEAHLEQAQELATKRSVHEEQRIAAFNDLEAQIAVHADAKYRMEQAETTIAELEQKLAKQADTQNQLGQAASTIASLEQQLTSFTELNAQHANHEEERIKSFNIIESQMESLHSSHAAEMQNMSATINSLQSTEAEHAAHEANRTAAVEELERQIAANDELLHQSKDTISVLEAQLAQAQRLESERSSHEEERIKAFETLQQQVQTQSVNGSVENESRLTIEKLEEQLEQAQELETKRSAHEEERIKAHTDLKDSKEALLGDIEKLKTTVTELEAQLEEAQELEAKRSTQEEERIKAVEELEKQISKGAEVIAKLEDQLDSAMELETKRSAHEEERIKALEGSDSSQQRDLQMIIDSLEAQLKEAQELEAKRSANEEGRIKTVEELERQLESNRTSEESARETTTKLEVQLKKLEVENSSHDAQHSTELEQSRETIAKLEAQLEEAHELESKRSAFEEERIKTMEDQQAALSKPVATDAGSEQKKELISKLEAQLKEHEEKAKESEPNENKAPSESETQVRETIAALEAQLEEAQQLERERAVQEEERIKAFEELEKHTKEVEDKVEQLKNDNMVTEEKLRTMKSIETSPDSMAVDTIAALEAEAQASRDMEKERAEHEEKRIAAVEELERQVAAYDELMQQSNDTVTKLEAQLKEVQEIQAKDSALEEEKTRAMKDLEKQAIEAAARDAMAKLEEQLEEAQALEAKRAAHEEDRIELVKELQQQVLDLSSGTKEEVEEAEPSNMTDNEQTQEIIAGLEAQLKEAQELEAKRAAHEDDRIKAFEELEQSTQPSAELEQAKEVIERLEVQLEEARQLEAKRSEYEEERIKAMEDLRIAEQERTTNEVVEDLKEQVRVQEEMHNELQQARDTIAGLEAQLSSQATNPAPSDEVETRALISALEVQLEEARELEMKRAANEEERINAFERLQEHDTGSEELLQSKLVNEQGKVDEAEKQVTALRRELKNAEKALDELEMLKDDYDLAVEAQAAAEDKVKSLTEQLEESTKSLHSPSSSDLAQKEELCAIREV